MSAKSARSMTKTIGSDLTTVNSISMSVARSLATYLPVLDKIFGFSIYQISG